MSRMIRGIVQNGKNLSKIVKSIFIIFRVFPYHSRGAQRLTILSETVRDLSTEFGTQISVSSIYTTIGIHRSTFDLVIVSITAKPYILQKILYQ